MPRSSWNGRSQLAAFAAIGLLVLPVSRAMAMAIPPADELVDPGGPEELQLEVRINGYPTNLIAAVRLEDERFAIAPDDLQDLGLIPLVSAIDVDGFVDLALLPGVTFVYEEATQVLLLTADDEARTTSVIDAGSKRSPTPLADPSVSALVVNYSLLVGAGGADDDVDLWNYDGITGWFDARFVGRHGTLAGSFALAPAGSEAEPFVRLDTTFTRSNQERMRTTRIGDVITGGLPWTRSVRLGGIQIARNFGLRPDLVTFPLPEFSGSAAVPSTLDVYVKDNRRFSTVLPGGPFSVVNLPITTGSGQARIVMKDQLGGQTIAEKPFFASPILLKPGLWDYSFEFGAPRLSYGQKSADYVAMPAVSTVVRRGISDRATLELHAEGAPSLANAGAGMAVVIGGSGTLTGSFSGSTAEGGRRGIQAGLGVEAEVRGIVIQGEVRRTWGHFADIVAVADHASGVSWRDAAPPTAIERVSVSIPLVFDPSSINLSFANVTNEGQRPIPVASATYSRQLPWGGTGFVTGNTQLGRKKNNFSIYTGISIPLGGRKYASTGYERDRHGSSFVAEVSQPQRAEIGSTGYRVRLATGKNEERSAYLNHRTRFANLGVTIDQFNERFRGGVSADGALIVTRGNAFFANRVDDAFAVIDVGAPDVPVTRENRPAGRTNRNGKLLITGLRSFETNRIAIDPVDLPVDTVIGETKATAVPADQGGTLVSFEITAEAPAALVGFIDDSGADLEVGLTGHLEGTDGTFIIGYDGESWIEHLGKNNRVVVDRLDKGLCQADFAFDPVKGSQVRIEDIVCHPI